MYKTEVAPEKTEDYPQQELTVALDSHQRESRPGRKALHLPIRNPSTQTNSNNLKPTINSRHSEMADGKNEARALRVLELMNDFRTLQVHITSLVTRSEANPPDQQSYYLDGYVVLRQGSAEAQALLASIYNPGALGIEPGRVPETEVQKATLQRIILDASTRRFLAHKIYMRSAAGLRWVHLRSQVLQGQKPNGRHVEALRAVDARLREELRNISDASVVSDLRQADRRKRYWLDEDPTLERMLAWNRRQR